MGREKKCATRDPAGARPYRAPPARPSCGRRRPHARWPARRAAQSANRQSPTPTHEPCRRCGERPPAGIGVDRAPVDFDKHGYGTLDDAYKARLKSSIRSSAFSSPTESRIVPSVIPAAARFFAETRKCVVLAGWITSDFASPTLARWEKILSDSMNLRP